VTKLGDLYWLSRKYVIRPPLRDFADRRHITFPMLSDAESKIIRALGILNETVPPGNPNRHAILNLLVSAQYSGWREIGCQF
jgi:hypothetical protein